MPRASAQNSPMKNPVAHEVPVIATGARPGESGSQRELFTEEASTVLVFENGGVIRLSAAVTVGQLLFLTNKGTNREVVAQVMRKRDFRPTSCYAEVEFSEPSPGFWGIEFPEMPELTPANAQQKEAAQLVQAAEAIADEPSAPARAPSAHEITALKQRRIHRRPRSLTMLLRNPSKKLPPAADRERCGSDLLLPRYCSPREARHVTCIGLPGCRSRGEFLLSRPPASPLTLVPR